MNKNIIIVIMFLAVVVFAFWHYSKSDTSTISTNNTTQTNTMKATLHTNKGDITVAFSDKTAPKTVANFVKLAQEGFYKGVKFHRVIKDFMIQAGDPNSKDDAKKNTWGQGGPGYKFDDELSGTETYEQGTLAMANAGPNTNGSQFFIMTAPNYPLPPKYTVFGHVVAGMDVALAIEKVPTETNDRPIDAVIINSITIE